MLALLYVGQVCLLLHDDRANIKPTATVATTMFLKAFMFSDLNLNAKVNDLFHCIKVKAFSA